jgi:mRNA interferase MazF
LQYLNTVCVAAITSTLRGVPSEVPLSPDLGLPKVCAVNLHNIFTIPRSEIGPYLVSLPDPVMNQVDRALVFALGVGENRDEGAL